MPSEAELRAAHGARWEEAAEVARRIVRRNALSEAQGHRCCHCGRRTDVDLEPGLCPTTEHVIPQARGGPDTDENVVMACARCNGSRGDRPIPEEGYVTGDRPTVAPRFDPHRNGVLGPTRAEQARAHRDRLRDVGGMQGGRCAACGGMLHGDRALLGWREDGVTRFEVVHRGCHAERRAERARHGAIRAWRLRQGTEGRA